MKLFVLTEEQIELIKQGAYQEGLHQGQEAGFKQGCEKGKEEVLPQATQKAMKLVSSKVSPQVKNIFNNKWLFSWGLANQFAQPLELMNAQVGKAAGGHGADHG